MWITLGGHAHAEPWAWHPVRWIPAYAGMTGKKADILRRGGGRLFVGVEVDEALAKAPVVVAGGDSHQARRIDRGFDRGLRCADDCGQIAAVDDDFHHGADAGR